MTFHVGQKVVCIKDNPGPEVAKYCNIAANQRSKKVTLGAVYTVREIDLRAVHLHGVATLRFEEIHGTIKHYDGFGAWESGGSFPASHFRPVVETKTDISVFTEILDRENAKPRDKVTA